jgi:hypothetical protein
MAYPGLYSLHLQRAVLLAELGHVNDARQVCRDCIDSQQANANGLFWCAAFMELLGDPISAASALQEFSEREPGQITSEDAQQATVAPALAYLTGRSDARTLLEAAGGVPGPRCEYAFLIGLRELGRGNRAAGLAALQDCLDTQVIIYGDHRFAQAMLARAKADPHWPRWISDGR